MSLFAPINLLWLLPLLGMLLALYFLRPRRRNVEVPSLFLWDAVALSSRSDKPFQRLKFSLLLLLQLLAVIFLIFVIARPMTAPRPIKKSLYVLILDQSASMKATDITPNRYAVLKLAAEDFVRNNLHGADTAMIVGAGPGPTLLCGETGDKARLIRKIEESAPMEMRTDVLDAVTFAHIISRHANDIVLFSDGAWDQALDQNLINHAVVPLQLAAIGTVDPSNVGIVSMTARVDSASSSAPQKVLVTIDRHHSSSANLVISVDRSAVQSVAIPAGDGSLTKIIPIGELRNGGIVTASLTGMSRDDFAVDNVSSLVVKPNSAKKVLLVTDADPYLERALALLPNVELYEVKPSQFVATTGQFDLVVYDQWLPASLPSGPALVFDAVNADMPVTPGDGSSEVSQVVDWDDADPIFSYVDLSNVHVRDALSVRPALWGAVVADLQHGPAIVKGSKVGRSIIWIGFSPNNSDLPLQIAFPILLSNIVETLTAEEAGVTDEHKTGEPVSLPPAGPAWNVTDPSGKTTVVFANDGGGSEYTGTLLVGLYQANSGASHEVFACNLASREQSDIAVKPHPLLSSLAASGPVPTQSRTNLAPWMALAALFIILIEWLVYNRPLRYTRPI